MRIESCELLSACGTSQIELSLVTDKYIPTDMTDREQVAEFIIKSLQETYKLDNRMDSKNEPSERYALRDSNEFVTGTPPSTGSFFISNLTFRGQPLPKTIATSPRSVVLNYTDGSHYTLNHVKSVEIKRLKDGSSTLALVSSEKRSQVVSDGITEQLSVDSTTIDVRLLKSVTINEVVDGLKQSREVVL